MYRINQINNQTKQTNDKQIGLDKKMKKYFHQYHVDSRQYKQDYIHPLGNNKSPTKPNATSSFFKPNHTPKSSINELNLNNITKNGHVKNKPSSHSQNNINPNKDMSENDLQIQSNQNTTTNRQSSLDSQRVRQKGFSLEYMKMTKKHKIKQLVNLQSQRSSMMVMNLNNSNTNNRGIRAKTTFDQPIGKKISGEVILRNTEYNLKKSQLMGLPELMRANLLLNKTLNDLNLPKTSAFGAKKKRVNPLLSRIEFAGNILQQSSNLNERKNNPSSQNTPISFIPLNNSKHSTDKKFFTSPSIIDVSKSTLKKSNYSPFKSRNGNYNENMNDIETKQFLNDSQMNIKPFSTSKDVKTYKLSKHKRINTEQNYLNEEKEQENKKKYLVIDDNQKTIRIIQDGLYGQVRLLSDLKQCFQISPSQSPAKSEKIPMHKIRQLIKLYVFGSKDSTIYPNKLFPQLDNIFHSQQQKHTIKKIIACQRLVIICIVDLISHQKLFNLVQQVKLTLITLIVIYLLIWKQITKLKTYDNIRQDVSEYFNQLIKTPKNKTKLTIDKHLKKQILPYIENLFRYSKKLFQKQCKRLIQEAKERTINRTFYQTLKKYAIYLTYNEERMVNKYSGTLISSFATCPAPYILTKAQKRYTLCVDLDQTLLYSKFTCAKKFDTSYRPGAKQFIIQLNKYYQIVIFTSAVKEYADQVIKPFVQFVDHILYRYHVTRGKNLTNTVKDLSRIGRKLERVIFIDDLECNIKLQPQNSIKVTPWKGDVNDKEIIELKGYLLTLGKDENDYGDVRKVVSQIKQKFKQHKKIH